MSGSPANAASKRLGAYFREFVGLVSHSPPTARHLDLLSRARAEWRNSWESVRSAESADRLPDRILHELLPHGSSAAVEGQGGWVHPIAEETDEVNSWHATWRKARAEEPSQLLQMLLGFLERVGREPDALAIACEELHRSLPPLNLPPAMLTPMLSALAPERFVSIHRQSLQVVCLYTGVQLRNDIAAYPAANRGALAWLDEMAVDGRQSPLWESPEADRFDSFCRWLIQEKKAPLDRASFTVSRDMYKDWPPMW